MNSRKNGRTTDEMPTRHRNYLPDGKQEVATTDQPPGIKKEVVRLMDLTGDSQSRTMEVYRAYTEKNTEDLAARLKMIQGQD